MDQCGLDQLVLAKTEPEKGTGRTRVLGKTNPAVRQEQSRFNSAHRVVDQGLELLPLLLSDASPQVLDFYRALPDKDNLSDITDPGHPGVANQLWIQSSNAVRLLGIAGGGGLPLQHTRCAVQFADRIDEGDKTIVGTQCAGESDLLMTLWLMNPDPPILDEALEQLNTLPEHMVPGVRSGVSQFQFLTRHPLLKQHRGWIFVTE